MSADNTKPVIPPADRYSRAAPVVALTGYVIGGVMAALPIYFDLEGKLTEVLGSKFAHAGPGLAVLASQYLNGVLAMGVNKARIEYKVGWPTMYASGDSQEAHRFNCVQRAHQNYLESLFNFYAYLFLASRQFPILTTFGSLVFLLGRYVGAMGYQSGDVSSKDKGFFGYLGLFFVGGLAVFSTVKKLL